MNLNMSFLLDPGRKHPAQQTYTHRGRPSLPNSLLLAKLGQALKNSLLRKQFDLTLTFSVTDAYTHAHITQKHIPCTNSMWSQRHLRDKGNMCPTLYLSGLFTVSYPVMLCNAHGCTPARCRHVLSADTGLFTLISLQLPQWQSQPIIALYTYHTTTHKHITEPEWTHVTGELSSPF